MSLVASAARADEFEASLSVGAEGGLAVLGEDGTDNNATVPAAGLAVGFTYGLSNLLALDAQLAGGTYGRATFEDVTVVVGGTPQPSGTLARTTRFGRAMAGATLRFGVRLIPTLGAALGVGARLRGESSFSNASTMNVRPEDDSSGFALDVLATVRAGLDYRISAHWIVGVDVAATHAIALDGPPIDTVTGGLHLAYYFYPLW